MNGEFVNENPISLARGRYMDVFPDGDYIVYAGNPRESDITGTYFARETGRGGNRITARRVLENHSSQSVLPARGTANRGVSDRDGPPHPPPNAPPATQTDALPDFIEFGRANARPTTSIAENLRGQDRRPVMNRDSRAAILRAQRSLPPERAEPMHRSVTDRLTGAADYVTALRGGGWDELRQQDASDPLPDLLSFDPEAIGFGLADEAMGIAEDLLRIPQMARDFAEMLPELAVTVVTLKERIEEHPELRDQFLDALPGLLGELAFEVFLGEVRNLLGEIREAVSAREYRTAQAKIAKLVAKIGLMIFAVRTAVMSVRNLPGAVGRLEARIEALGRRYRRLVDSLPDTVKRLISDETGTLFPRQRQRSIDGHARGTADNFAEDTQPVLRHGTQARPDLTVDEIESLEDLYVEARVFEPDSRISGVRPEAKQAVAFGHVEGQYAVTRSGSSARRPLDLRARSLSQDAVTAIEHARELVLDFRQRTGYHPPAHSLDNGVPGSFYASHAEIQQLQAHANSSGILQMGVNKDMCGSCRRALRAAARRSRREIRISDPSYIRRFHPDGSIDVHPIDEPETILRFEPDAESTVSPNAPPSVYEGVVF